MKLFQKIHERERAFARNIGRDLHSQRGWCAARFQFEMMDHQFLRHLWTNFDQVAPGVYRSNQPNKRRLAYYKSRGIKTVLNLRGKSDAPHYMFERLHTRQLGLTLVSRAFNARSAPDRDAMLELIALFPTLKKPFVLHCKSGADRAGFVSALYLLTQEGASVEVARKQLSFKYLHLKNTATGILDEVLDLYEPHQAELSFEDWVRTKYDADETRESFAAKREKS